MLEFEAMYRRYSSDVYRFALWLCGNPTLADDITAETFSRAWLSFDQAKATSVKGYLLTIARHLAWKLNARAQREVSMAVDYRDEHPAADDRLAASAELRHVLKALHDLPEVDRAALALRVDEELSYEEIASILGLTVSAAKVKVHRLRLRLALAVQEGEAPATPRPETRAAISDDDEPPRARPPHLTKAG
jgi:RNA polymerase sigma-70 factor, ECF subfamily